MWLLPGVDRMTGHGATRTAEIIAVGSELLGSTRLDTNSLFLAERLAALGIELRSEERRRRRPRAISPTLLPAGARARRSRDPHRRARSDRRRPDARGRGRGAGLAADRGRGDRRADRDALRARAACGCREVNRRQAHGAARRDRCSTTRTARRPGLLDRRIGEQRRRAAARPAARAAADVRALVVRGRARARAPARARSTRRRSSSPGAASRTSKRLAQPIYSRWRRRVAADRDDDPRAPGQIELHLTVRVDATRPRRGSASARRARASWWPRSAPTCSAPTAGRWRRWSATCCASGGLTIAAAESCTGGLLMSRLTDVPGSSAYVPAASSPTATSSRRRSLGVPAALIAAHGAVSEPVAVRWPKASARGPAPTSASASPASPVRAAARRQKPVGTVVIAVIVPTGRDGAHASVLRRPRAGEVPGDAGRARHGPADARCS